MEPILGSPVGNWDWDRVTQFFGVNYTLYNANFGLPGHNGLDVKGIGDKFGYHEGCRGGSCLCCADKKLKKCYGIS